MFKQVCSLKGFPTFNLINTESKVIKVDLKKENVRFLRLVLFNVIYIIYPHIALKKQQFVIVQVSDKQPSEATRVNEGVTQLNH